MPGTIAPFPKHQFFTTAGVPAVGYKVFTYLAGTTTKEPTYSEVTLTTANANPIVLDSGGRATIFLDAKSYKFVFSPPTDTDPPTSAIWTQDNIGATPATNVDLDIQGTAGENLALGNAVYLSAGDGSRTAGSWYKADADLEYASSNADATGMVPVEITSGEKGSIRLVGRLTGLSGLTIGSVYYISQTAGAIVTPAPTSGFVRFMGVADTTSSLIIPGRSKGMTRQLSVTFGVPGGGVLATGVRGYLPVEFTCYITGWQVFANTSGSIEIEVWKDTYANFPPNSFDLISGTEPVIITTALKAEDKSLSSWTTLITAGDVLAFNVNSVTDIEAAYLTLIITIP